MVGLPVVGMVVGTSKPVPPTEVPSPTGRYEPHCKPDPGLGEASELSEISWSCPPLAIYPLYEVFNMFDRMVLTVLLGTLAQAQWETHTLTTLPSGWRAQDTILQVADMDLDGRVDAVLGNVESKQFGVLYNDGTQAWGFRPLGQAGIFLHDIHVIDADLDGDLDIVTSGQNPGLYRARLEWHSNPVDPTGLWATTLILSGSDKITFELRQFQDEVFGLWLSVEFDDLSSGRGVRTYLPSSSGFQFGLGAETPGSRQIAYLEMNGDGAKDYVHSQPFNTETGWAITNHFAGQWRFFPPNLLGNGASGFPLAADLNQDGKEDLVLLNANRLQFFETLGFTGFAAPLDVPGYPGTAQLDWSHVQDLDGDGDRDLIVHSSATSAVFWMENTNMDLLAPAQTILASSGINPRYRTEWIDMDLDGDLDAVYLTGNFPQYLAWAENPTSFGFDTSCTAEPNSTGQYSTLSITGSNRIELNQTHLVCTGLPPGMATMFLVSDADSTGSVPIGSQGPLCLGGTIGRYNGLGQVNLSDPHGIARLPIDLSTIPMGPAPVAVMTGQTLYFQAWHRDIVAGQPTNQFSSARGVTFQ